MWVKRVGLPSSTRRPASVTCSRGDGVGDGESRRPDCRTLDAIDARCVLRATATIACVKAPRGRRLLQPP